MPIYEAGLAGGKLQCIDWFICSKISTKREIHQSNSMEWKAKLCSYLFGIMLINDNAKNTYHCFTLYDEWAHVHFRSKHRWCGWRMWIVIEKFRSVKIITWKKKHKQKWNDKNNGKNSCKFHACKPLSVQYLLTQPLNSQQMKEKKRIDWCSYTFIFIVIDESFSRSLLASLDRQTNRKHVKLCLVVCLCDHKHQNQYAPLCRSGTFVNSWRFH